MRQPIALRPDNDAAPLRRLARESKGSGANDGSGLLKQVL